MAAAGALSVLAVTGCSTGFGAQTSEVYNAPAGTDIRIGDVKVLSAAIVVEDDAATLSAGLVGPANADDALTSVQVTDADGAPVTTEIADDTVDIPADTLVQTARDAEIAIDGTGLEPGRLLDVSFTFENAQPVSGQLMVMDRAGAYADVSIPDPPAQPH